MQPLDARHLAEVMLKYDPDDEPHEYAACFRVSAANFCVSVS